VVKLWLLGDLIVKRLEANDPHRNGVEVFRQSLSVLNIENMHA